MLIVSVSKGGVFTSVKDGAWGDPCTWDLECSTGIPTFSDQVVIDHNVIIDQDIALISSASLDFPVLIINDGASLRDTTASVCDPGYVLTIGDHTGSQYAGFQIYGDLEVWNLTLVKTKDSLSILETSGTIIIHSTFNNANNGDIIVDGLIDIYGDWALGQGNTSSEGLGFIYVEGCVSTGGGGNPSNVEVNFCVNTHLDCACVEDDAGESMWDHPHHLCPLLELDIPYTEDEEDTKEVVKIYPTVLQKGQLLFVELIKPMSHIKIYTLLGYVYEDMVVQGELFTYSTQRLQPGNYLIQVNGRTYKFSVI
jgi:hypothetical protein